MKKRICEDTQERRKATVNIPSHFIAHSYVYIHFGDTETNNQAGKVTFHMDVLISPQMITWTLIPFQALCT